MTSSTTACDCSHLAGTLYAPQENELSRRRNLAGFLARFLAQFAGHDEERFHLKTLVLRAESFHIVMLS
jgi:hypothetical protein